MRHRRSGARATVTALAFALLGLGPGPALAHAPKPSSPQYTAVDQNTHAYAYDARTGLMTELESPVGPDGPSTAAGTSQNGHVAGTWDYPDTPFEGATPMCTTARSPIAYDIRTGHTVLATTRPGTYAYDLRTKTLSPFGPGPFGYVYRVDTREFTLLPAVGGVHSTASDVDRHGAPSATARRPPPIPPLPTASATPPPGPSGAADTATTAY